MPREGDAVQAMEKEFQGKTDERSVKVNQPLNLGMSRSQMTMMKVFSGDWWVRCQSPTRYRESIYVCPGTLS